MFHTSSYSSFVMVHHCLSEMSVTLREVGGGSRSNHSVLDSTLPFTVGIKCSCTTFACVHVLLVPVPVADLKSPLPSRAPCAVYIYARPKPASHLLDWTRASYGTVRIVGRV